MIRINFKRKICKEEEFASEVLEILEEKLEEMKIKVPSNMLDANHEQTRFREDLRKQLVCEIADFIAINKKVLAKKVA